MLRLPHLLALALAALVLGVAPASAVATSAEDTCVATYDDAVLPGDEVADDESDWGDDEAATAQAAGDEDDWGDEEDPGDDWGDDGGDDGDWADDEDWDDESCEEDAADVAAPLISQLRATPERGGRVRVRFQLDRAGDVTLSLSQLGGRASRSCAQRARGAKRRAPHTTCGRSVVLHGTVSIVGGDGANATTLRRWNGHRLAPGGYRLTATPSADGGHDASTTFTLPAPAARRR